MNQRELNQVFMRGLSGSLAFRILVIETVFLVIPLLIFAGVMYYEDTRLKIKDNIFTLNLILDGKEELIQEIIDRESHFLINVNRMNPNSSQMKSLIDHDIFSTVLHLVRKQGGYICDKASTPELVGMDFSSIIPKELTSLGMLVGNASTGHIYFFKPFLKGDEIWASELVPKRLIDKLSMKKNLVYPTVISLLSEKGTVLLSTDIAWKNWQLPSVFHEKENFSFIGEEYVGELNKINQSNLFLLAAIPQYKNFVDIPYFFAKMMTLLLIILLIGGGVTLWITIRLGKPLKTLCLAMERIRSSDFSARYIPDRMGFEINIVGVIFNTMIESLIDFMDRIKHERIAKEDFERELMIGREVQTSILPKELPIFPRLDIAARFVSAKEVGGDFYDFLVQPGKIGHRLFFSIADTSGKGISACLYSLTLRSMLRSYGEIHHELSTIIQETNNLFCVDTGDTGVFVTAWIALFDEKTSQLHFSNCGHFPAYLMHANGSIQKLTTPGMALGVENFNQVHTESIQLKEGDSLLLFTDGVVEAHNDKIQMFGEEKLMASFANKKDLKAEQIVDRIIEEVAFFAEGSPQYDDLTLVVLKVQ